MTVTIESHLAPDSSRQALRADVVRGLTATPKSLPPKWFYDQRGSDLFDQITRLPEYYPTRTERSILARHAGDIAATTGATALVELGSGTSEKTRLLLSALRAGGTLRRFVPFDVDPSTLTDAGEAIASEYPGVDIHAVVGDFERHLPTLPRDDRRLVAFLGSTIGNLEPQARKEFLTSLRSTLRQGDAFLLGTDLVKDTRRLVAAYDDESGVTAEFNRNVLTVVNRELGADFDLGSFEHVVRWDPDAEWIEMRLRSSRRQIVSVSALDLQVDFAAGEEMRTEVSAKFRSAGVEAELADAGLHMAHWWTDPSSDFGLSLSFPE